MLSEDNIKLKKAGCNLAIAATKIIADYDGVHRLAFAVSEWYKTIAKEGQR